GWLSGVNLTLQISATGGLVLFGTLYIKAHIIDAYVGNVQFQLSFREKELVIFMRKKEESLFREFDGHLYCTQVESKTPLQATGYQTCSAAERRGI
ncbi:MAG: hypothetical protein K2P65_14510, partial [Lachnospiraceae bacterium]|nr:hypothetical protein [Lachnospiraceae bacterium]